ncbi:hypothetical protein VTL71DRAFT_7376 [Oculimacula yallundae]|uniref:Uncharacterized protein n=1 Tax=Oculimacula yallundae TaxID=86028 RepID=A0ABR4BXY2_9HELO
MAAKKEVNIELL